MRFTAAEQRAKLATLMKIEGNDSIEDLAQAILSDTVSPAICMNEDCDSPAKWSQKTRRHGRHRRRDRLGQ